MTHFEILLNNLLISTYEQGLKEPEYLAIDTESATRSYLNTRWQYTNEIRRVLRELEVSLSIMKYDFNFRKMFIPGINKEDIIVHQQGNFLDLVHQLKDKLILLIGYLLEDPAPKGKLMSGDLKKYVHKFDKRLKKILEDQRIDTELKQPLSIWDEDNLSSHTGITVSLRKRRAYHHFISNLHLNSNLLEIKSLRLILQQQSSLSDYGKTFLADRLNKREENLILKSTKDCEETLTEIKENLELISKYFIKKKSLCYSLVNSRNILNEYIKLDQSFEIKNQCSMQLIPQDQRAFLDKSVKLCRNQFGSMLFSVYIVGSVARGEYNLGKSDVNLIVILDNKVEQPDEIKILFQKGGLDIQFYSKDDFFHKTNKKVRFICQYDGIQIYGKNIIKDEFPNSGLALSYVLNNDLVNTIKELNYWVNKQSRMDKKTIARKSKKLASDIFNFFYGIVKANSPSNFSFSKIERINQINASYPKHARTIKTLLSISRKGVGTKRELKLILSRFSPMINRNIDKIEKVLKANVQASDS